MTVIPEPLAELAEATDADIEDAVKYADPMVLRGLLYQLTGDDAGAAMAVKVGGFGPGEVAVLAISSDLELLQAKAVAFLKSRRDAGMGNLGVESPERLPHSLALVAGVKELPDSELTLWKEELALDPWERGLVWEQVPPPERLRGMSVMVIGAGMGGLNAAVQLKHAGINFTVVEKNPGVGGTWYENRYPGARVDSPSRSYTHIFGVDYHAPYAWCTSEENRKYFDWVADTYCVREKIIFDTEVTSVVWHEDASEWEIAASGPEGKRVWRANVVITAVGTLSRPNLPEIEGASDFEGQIFHTARWPQDLDLRGKRVAVIGTGCTGYQMIPVLALEASHVTVFQRTPQWVFGFPGYLAPNPAQVMWLDRNFPLYTNFARFRANWLARPEMAARMFDVDPEFDDPHALSAYNKRIREERIEWLHHRFADRPDLIDKMIPDHPPFSTRPVYVDSGYSIIDALLSDTVTLVTDGIQRITRSGIEASDGSEHEVDVIVYATGFKANEFLWPMEVRGRDNRRVEELWAKDGPRAYLGTMLPGFPNFFMLYGPNTNPFGGGLGVVNHEEMITRYALELVAHLILNDKQSVDVTEDGYWRYNHGLDQRDSLKVYQDARANSYYRNGYGRSAVNCPFPATDMWHFLRTPNFDELIIE